MILLHSHGYTSASISPMYLAHAHAMIAVSLTAPFPRTIGVVDFHDALLWTVQKLAHKDVEIYSVFCDRPFSFMFFAKLADTHMFDVKPIALDPAIAQQQDDDAEINMHLITLRQ